MRKVSVQTILRSVQGLTLDGPSLDAAREAGDALTLACELVAFGERCRLLEVEIYLHREQHPDPFAHRDPIQTQVGRWYLHRKGRSYRNGSFKGLDMTFGGPDFHGGILIRTLRTGEGRVINGPSLCVDYVLERSGCGSLGELDERIGADRLWEEGNPLQLRPAAPIQSTTYATPRVGLSLARVPDDPSAAAYLLRAYRFLREPQEVKKGRPHLILALHQQGADAATIQVVTRSPLRTIQQYVQWHDQGAGGEVTAEQLAGRRLGTRELCQLAGIHWTGIQERGRR